MFVMISAILLAWAPTVAYAGFSGVVIETVDKKGNEGLTELCGEQQFTIDIHGKGKKSFAGNPLTRIPAGTGSIDVDFKFDGQITLIQFNKNNGAFISSFSGSIDPPLIIEAKIASTTICGFDIPKGTTSLTISST